MDRSEQRLVAQLDAGEQTQHLQEDILDTLDDAIMMALLSAQPSAASPSSSRPPADAEEESAEPRATKPGEQPGAAPPGGRPGDEATPRSFDRTGQPWGNLPPRERDEILQGTRDRVLEEYREQIERYYRALAEREAS
jgi:hypothetical protein